MEVGMRFIVVALAALGQAVAAAGQDRPGTESTLVLEQERAPRDLAPIFVQPADGGSEFKGYLLELGPRTLKLLIDGHRVELPLDDVRRVETGGDSLKNGALIGALIGGLWCAIVCGQGLDDTTQLPAAVAVSAAFWAAVGAGIDATIPGRTTIYRRPSAQLRGGGGARAALSLSFRF